MFTTLKIIQDYLLKCIVCDENYIEDSLSCHDKAVVLILDPVELLKEWWGDNCQWMKGNWQQGKLQKSELAFKHEARFPAHIDSL